MPLTVDPHRLTGLPFVSKATATDDYGIFIDGLRAGRIMRQPRSFGRDVWFWTVTGPVMVQAGLASNGEAETLAEARAKAEKVRVAVADEFARNMTPMIREIQKTETSLRGIARQLVARNVPTRRGGTWTPVQVTDLLKRLDRGAA